MFDPESYIKRSGQSWKVWLSLLLSLAGAILMLIGFTSASENEQSSFFLFVFGGSFLGFIGLIWLSISIRCRNCKTSLGWNAIRHQTHDGWFVWLLKTKKCPVCDADR